MIYTDSIKVTVGKVIQPHGINGQIKIETESDNPERFQKDASIIIGDHLFSIRASQVINFKYLLLSLDGVTTRLKAEALQGSTIYVTSDAIPSLPAGTYYHYQLIGMAVFDESNTEIGIITEILDTGANDVYLVEKDERELLIPAIANVIQIIEIEKNTMKVSLPEGLEWRNNKPKN